jgi:hypothetical protein
MPLAMLEAGWDREDFVVPVAGAAEEDYLCVGSALRIC